MEFVKLFAGWIAQIMLGLAVVFGALLSCDNLASEPRTDAPKLASWTSFPVQLAISQDLDPCQSATVRAAATWWEARTGRVLFAGHYVPGDDPLVNGLPTYGVIAVSNAPLGTPETLDEVELVQAKQDPHVLFSADMRVGKCSFRAYAHELGHALGLLHATGDDALMEIHHRPDAMDVSDAELLRVVN